MTKKIITISREFGSGGRFIGEEVAQKLGIAYYDKDIIGQIAEQSGLSPKYIQENAELSPKKGMFAYAFTGRDITGKSIGDIVYEAQRKVIMEIAEKESCVIIGRNADFILKSRDDVLNVFIHGNMPEKVQRVCKLYNVNESDAVKMINDTDKRRRTNYNFYTDQKWGMADYNIFIYGEAEISYLKKRDKRLAEVIDKVGPIERKVIPDLFAALINSIVGQQISTKAHKTIWEKMVTALGEITPHVIDSLSDEELQRFGITFKKAAYIKSAAQKVLSGEFEIEALRTMPDEDVCTKLIELDGIGVWTAEMFMLFSMQRRNIFSFGDLALLRGMRMVYHHRVINKQLFTRYKKRFSPYASVASLYFWAVAGGAIDRMKDYTPVSNKNNGNRRENKSGKKSR